MFSATAPRFYTWLSVTPSDSATLNEVGSAIRAVGAGTIVYEDGDGNAISTSLAAGEIFPTSVTKIRATGTSATGLLVAYGFNVDRT